MTAVIPDRQITEYLSEQKKQKQQRSSQEIKKEARKYLYVASTRIDSMTYQMHIQYGFEDTGLVDAGETVLKLKIS